MKLSRRMLTGTCDVSRQAAGQDALGQRNGAWADDSTGNPCLLQPKSGKEFKRDDRVVVSTLKLFLQPGVDVTEDDRIVPGGKTYNVLFVWDAAGRGHHLELDLELAA